MNQTQEAILKLKARIERNRLEDEEDLYQYIQLASRVKGLGDSEAFEKIPEIVKRPEFAGRLEELLAERCRRGMWDLDEQEGEELAISLIEAQDFCLFYEFSRNSGLYSENIHKLFEQWAEETSLTSINEEAASLIRDWRATYPLPDEMLLPVISDPVSDFDYEILGKVASFLSRKEVKGTWSQQITRTEFKQKVCAYNPAIFAACDDGKPAESLLRQQSQLIYTMDDRQIQIQRSLNPRWMLGISITNADGKPIIPDSVRVGVFPATQDPNRPERWLVDLSSCEGKMREFALNGPTVVQLDALTSVKITFGEE